MPISTSGAYLTRISGVDLDHFLVGAFCLTFKKIKELPPCCVSDAFVNTPEVVLFHVVDRQIFNAYSVKSVYKFTGFLVDKVISFPVYSFVNTGDYFADFLPGFRTFFLGRQFTLRLRKGFLFLPEKARILNFLSIRKRCKAFKSHIKTNSWIHGLLNRIMLYITNKSYIPFAGRRPLYSTGFDCAFDRSVEFDFDTAYLGKLNDILEEFKTGLRICERIIAVLPLKTRIAWLFTGFYPTEEGTKSKVNSGRHILKALAKSIVQKWMFFFKYWDRPGLIVSRKAFLFRFPSALALFKEIIVEPPTGIKRVLKFCRLCFVRKYPVFKSSSYHGYTIDNFCVMSRTIFKKGRQFICQMNQTVFLPIFV